MPPFGHRTRLNYMLSEVSSRSNGNVVLSEMTDFIKKRHELLHPGEGEVAGVRIMVVRYPVGDPFIARPKGHWDPPPLEQVAEWRRRAFYERSFEDAVMPPCALPPAGPHRE